MPQPFRLRADDMYVSYVSERPQTDEGLSNCHCHDVYEFLYVVRGEGQYIVEGKSYTMSEGTLMVIHPLKYHFVKVAPGQVYERYVLQFPPAALLGAAPQVLDSLQTATSDGAGCFFPPHAMSPMLLSVFDRLSTVERLPEPMRAPYTRLLLSEIVLLLAPSTASHPPMNCDELGARVLQYLNEHVESELRLDDIARHFFVSKYYLCRAFKKHNGTSIHTYITQKRVLYAKRLMEAGESASAAAYRVGFGDYSAFYRAYVKVTGNSPVISIRKKEKRTEE